jgi:uncharacterized repeat protein (TIGR03803 family)
VRIIKICLALAVLAASNSSLTATAAPIYAFRNLFNFATDGSTGTAPDSSMVIDASGNIYGTTNGQNYGTVFELTAHTYAFATVATFTGANTGGNPTGPLAIYGGSIYGGTRAGGSSNLGAIFKFNTSTHSLTAVASFTGTNGVRAVGGVFVDASGNLYGTTAAGGPGGYTPDNQGLGTVFELPAGTNAITTIASFNKTNGGNTQGSVVRDTAGNLYGTSTNWGGNSDGAIFEVPAGTSNIVDIYSFDGTNGANPQSSPTLGSDDYLYGTALGSVYKLNLATNTYSVIAQIAQSTAPLVIGPNGDFFGTTASGGAFNDGSVFELNPATGNVTILHSFNGADGRQVQNALVFDANGDIFGTTNSGGIGAGTVWELAVPEPSTLSLLIVGATLALLGQAMAFAGHGRATIASARTSMLKRRGTCFLDAKAGPKQ